MDCAVPGCVRFLGEVKKKHTFPKDPARLKAWMKFCGTRYVSQHGHICGNHFRDEDYQDSYKILGHPKRDWKLNRDAVPTLNGPDPAKISEAEAHPESVEQPMESGSVEMEVEEEVAATAKCRLCLNVPEPTDAGVCSLFAVMDEQESISCHLRKLFQLEFEEAEGWPSIICGPCVKFIGQMKHFKEMIVSSHCKLYQQILRASEDQPQQVEASPYLPIPPEIEKMLENVAKERGLLKCHVCDEETANLTVLGMHIKEKHDLPPYIFCCETKHSLLTNEWLHIEEHLELKCTDCNIAFTSKLGLDYHQRSIHKIKPRFVCHICGISKKTSAHLKVHALIHEPKSKHPFKCKYCDSRFITMGATNRHINRMHEVKQRCVCDVCGKAFSCKSTLSEHLRMHSQASKAKTDTPAGKEQSQSNKKRNKDHIPNCFVCGLKAVNLKDHMRRKHNRTTELTPEELEIVKCSECDMSFKRADMRLHTKMHSKGMYCDLCCTRIEGGFKYTLHMDKHSGREFNCNHCDAVLKTRNAHWYHMRDKHPQVEEPRKRCKN